MILQQIGTLFLGHLLQQKGEDEEQKKSPLNGRILRIKLPTHKIFL